MVSPPWLHDLCAYVRKSPQSLLVWETVSTLSFVLEKLKFCRAGEARCFRRDYTAAVRSDLSKPLKTRYGGAVGLKRCVFGSFGLCQGARSSLLWVSVHAYFSYIAWSSSSENVRLRRYVALPELSCLIGFSLMVAGGGSLLGSAE